MSGRPYYVSTAGYGETAARKALVDMLGWNAIKPDDVRYIVISSGSSYEGFTVASAVIDRRAVPPGYAWKMLPPRVEL